MNLLRFSYAFLRLTLTMFASTAAALAQAPSPAASETGQPQFPVDIQQYATIARFENDGSGQREESFRVRINSTDGAQQMQELSFPHDGSREKVELKFLRVEKADGTVTSVGDEAMTEVSADQPGGTRSGGPETHIKAPALNPGDTLVYDIVKHVAKGESGEFWYEHDFVKGIPVGDERLTIDVPAARPVILHSSNTQYTTTVKEGRKIYEWKLSSTVPVYNPPDELYHEPDVQLTSFTNWKEVGRWYATFERRAAVSSPKIRDKALELTRGMRSQPRKLQALYDFVSAQIQTSRDSFNSNGYQPRSADDVLATGSGSVSEKHALFAGMLASVGIPSNTALLGSHKLDSSFPSPAKLDHVVTVIPQEKTLIWADTSLEVAPLGLLASRRRGVQALLIPAMGPGRIIETPATPPFAQIEIVEMEDTISELGKLTQIVRYQFRGDRELGFRFAFRRTPPEKWKSIAENLLRFDGMRGTVMNVKAGDPTNTRKPFEVEIELSQPAYVNWSVEKNTVHIPMPTIAMPGMPLKSTRPAILDSPLDKTMQLKLTLPAGYVIKAPGGTKALRDYADYRSRYSVNGTVLTAEREVRLKQHEIAPNLAEDYQAFNREIEADESADLSLEKTAAGRLPASATPDELQTTAEEELRAHHPQNAVTLLQRVLQLDSQHKDAYRILGAAYVQLDRPDDAAAAFRKQVAENPKDDKSLTELATLLAQGGKLDEAAAVYQKLLELNPQDANSHRMLGGIYLDQQKFAQALPELEKADTLTPNNPLLELALGRAYLHSDKTSKALETYAKAAKGSNNAQIKSAIAGDLAEKGVALDRAQEYAESAVKATDDELLQIDPAHIIQWQLTRVAQLGESWDTLGWIYLQRGALEKAEPMLRASWDLLYEASTGDHLNQLYKKLGKNSVAPTGELSYPLGKLPQTADAKADFYVVLVPGEPDKPARVEDASFIQGDETLKQLTEKIRSTDFGKIFPDSSPSKIIRRGTASCTAKTGDCVFTFAPLGQMHSSQ